MKILISAYACEPNSGSEPFLGWRWVTEIAKHHEVYVITRDNNQTAIESYLTRNGDIKSLHFIYVDLSKKLTFWKKGRRGMKLYYTLWQRKAVKVAKQVNDREHFDLVHHITFGAYTQPTYMYKLGIPFVWGPLGGGERMPKISGRKQDLKSFVYEKIRSLQIYIMPLLPYARKATKAADAILATTSETEAFIPQQYRNKVQIMQSLGIDEEFISGKSWKVDDGKIRILMVGRLIGWKGFDFGIEAFKLISEKYDNVELHIRGKGELKSKLMENCGNLLNTKIFFSNDYLEYSDMYGFYTKHDIFLNATLHDSGCLALLEAMSAGLPIVCVDTGGPKVLTDESYAIKIEPSDYKTMIKQISEALISLIEDTERRKIMGQNAKRKVEREYMYGIKYERLEDIYSSLPRERKTR